MVSPININPSDQPFDIKPLHPDVKPLPIDVKPLPADIEPLPDQASTEGAKPVSSSDSSETSSKAAFRKLKNLKSKL